MDLSCASANIGLHGHSVQKTAQFDQELFDQLTGLYPRWVANQSWFVVDRKSKILLQSFKRTRYSSALRRPRVGDPVIQ